MKYFLVKSKYTTRNSQCIGRDLKTGGLFSRFWKAHVNKPSRYLMQSMPTWYFWSTFVPSGNLIVELISMPNFKWPYFGTVCPILMLQLLARSSWKALSFESKMDVRIREYGVEKTHWLMHAWLTHWEQCYPHLFRDIQVSFSSVKAFQYTSLIFSYMSRLLCYGNMWSCRYW